ncbi:MAG: hypothetical protein D8M57_05630 [Candidatus Scalindua sp. AMX11]|nr:MAG: hypothetical protein DWQ00_01995 [Candidatus Scalindua sp.]NOG82819.1 hypothetical protein [Planctomycetota bacterium]RZV86168.1 MAG: hypothetical protein EX341_07305 [Candidatus Scalindua sp. SCAELEC01]TDE65788.1 MAG: hypothetical protein D8M57_05630 [Candidatus Scalindua sp. AMX11]GJQ58290.1 MAG: hypothetical protein SCALA701_10910 [Candidatus Scalindua sp.]
MSTTLTKITKEAERRADTRLELSLPITLFADPTVELKSKNICTGGVSFDVNTDLLGSFPLGKIIQIEIVAKMPSPRLPEKTVTLVGNGLVVRISKPEITKQRRKQRWCVALQFTETLKVESVQL